MILYVDDFEICNPLGTSRKKPKIVALYWILGNLPPDFQSLLSSIHLAALINSNNVKVYDKVLEPLTSDLITLEQNGVFVSKLGKTLKGTVQCVVADNLGAHSIAGFVEFFSGRYICRFCTADRLDFQTKDVSHRELKRFTQVILKPLRKILWPTVMVLQGNVFCQKNFPISMLLLVFLQTLPMIYLRE